MSEDLQQEQPQQEEQFEEKRDSKGRRITKKRMESMRKNLINANKKRLAKKQVKQQVDEYDIQSESGSESDSSSDDDELLDVAMGKKKKVKDTVNDDDRIIRLERSVANMAQELKQSRKDLKRANKSGKSEKIVVLHPKNNTQAQQEKKPYKQTDRTDQLIELLKNNVMF